MLRSLSVSLVTRGCGFSHGILCWSLLLAVGLSLSVSYGIATETIVLGSREGHWIYGYARAFNLVSIAAFLLASGAAGALLAVTNPAGSRGWPLVVVWLLLGFGLQAL